MLAVVLGGTGVNYSTHDGRNTRCVSLLLFFGLFCGLHIGAFTCLNKFFTQTFNMYFFCVILRSSIGPVSYVFWPSFSCVFINTSEGIQMGYQGGL